MHIDVFILIILLIAIIAFCIYSIKKWKKAKIVWIIIFIIALIIGIIIAYKKTSFHSFSLDTDDKYIVTTDAIEYSYLSDGGTHYNTYYEIDFSNNKVEKRQDYVYASVSSLYTVKFFKSYSGKLIEEWTIDDLQVKQLKTLLENRIKEGDAEEETSEQESSEQKNTSKSKINIEEFKYDYHWKVSSKDVENIEMSEEEKDEFLEIID